MESWGVKTKKRGHGIARFRSAESNEIFFGVFLGESYCPGHLFGLHPLIPGNIGIFPEVDPS